MRQLRVMVSLVWSRDAPASRPRHGAGSTRTWQHPPGGRTCPGQYGLGYAPATGAGGARGGPGTTIRRRAGTVDITIRSAGACARADIGLGYAPAAGAGGGTVYGPGAGEGPEPGGRGGQDGPRRGGICARAGAGGASPVEDRRTSVAMPDGGAPRLMGDRRDADSESRAFHRILNHVVARV